MIWVFPSKKSKTVHKQRSRQIEHDQVELEAVTNKDRDYGLTVP